MGGGTREQCGSNKAFTGLIFWAPLKKPNNWSDLAGDEGGRRGGCGPGRRARGGRWGGHQRAVWSNKAFTLRNLTIWLVTRGGGVGGVGQGGLPPSSPAKSDQLLGFFKGAQKIKPVNALLLPHCSLVPPPI